MRIHFFLSLLFYSSLYSNINHYSIDAVIHRLNTHVHLIKKSYECTKKVPHITMIGKPLNEIFYCDNITCLEHELAKLCIKKINLQKKIDPLFEIWDLFNKSFKLVDPHIFLRDSALIILSLYKNAFIELKNMPYMKRLLLEDIINLYENASALPIGELLEILDTCYEQMIELMDECDVHSSQGWYQWITHNWWIPPVLIAAVTFATVKKMPYG